MYFLRRCRISKKMQDQLILFAVFILIIYTIDNFGWRMVNTEQEDELEHSINEHFHPKSNKHEKTFHYVCFEPNTSGRQVKYHTAGNAGDDLKKEAYFTPDVQLTIYNAKSDRISYIGVFPVIFRQSAIPETHKLITSHPAYFAMIVRVRNVFHELEQFLYPVYRMLRSTKRLGSEIPNQVFYVETRSYIDEEKSEIYFTNRTIRDGGVPIILEDLLISMSVNKNYSHYLNGPINTCYKNAMFEIDRNLPTSKAIPNEFRVSERRSMARYITTATKVYDSQCNRTNNPRITIINRENNRIIFNMKEVLEKLKTAGIRNVNLVSMEKLSMQEQVRTIHCTDILVGVHGAALHWAFFMPKGRVLLEIAWPPLKWTFFFSDHVFDNDPHLTKIRLTVKTEDLFINMSPYIHRMDKRFGHSLTREEIKRVSVRDPKDSLMFNQYREANLVLDPKLLVSSLKKALKEVNTRLKLP